MDLTLSWPLRCGWFQVPAVTAAQAFQHYAALYVKYVQIFRKLETAYDNMVHPQKRIDVKSVLELVQVCVQGCKALQPCLRFV